MTNPAIDAILTRAGYDRHNGALRTATARNCRRCHQPTLTGLDADIAALTVTVDPTPINPAGELAALLTGRYTCDLTWRGHRYELHHRAAHHITAHPAGTDPRTDVLVQHQCDQPVHPDHIARHRPAAATTPTTDGNPPY